MIEHALANVEAWVSYIEAYDIPVLAHTRAALDALHEHIDEVSAVDLAHLVEHDALLALIILRVISSHRNRRQHRDVTSIERAMLMTGMEPILRTCRERSTVEDRLQGHPNALALVRGIMQRAHLASTCAASWATRRHDIDTHEVMTAALLHDLVEILLGCIAPNLMLRVRAMQQADHHLRSHLAQRAVFGFRLQELQLALVERWELPSVIRTLMDDSQASHPRVQTVATALAFARHASNGWDDAALPDDYLAVAKLCGTDTSEARAITLAAVLKAGHDYEWYDTPPVAASIIQYNHAPDSDI